MKYPSIPCDATQKGSYLDRTEMIFLIMLLKKTKHRLMLDLHHGSKYSAKQEEKLLTM